MIPACEGLAKPAAWPPASKNSLALHLQLDTLQTRRDQLHGEVGLPGHLLDQHILAVVDFDLIAVDGQLCLQCVADVLGDVILAALVCNVDRDLRGSPLVWNHLELDLAGALRPAVDCEPPL